MVTAYSPILKLALPVQGELTGTWGDVVNDNITSMVEQAIAGRAVINTWTANAHTLTTANGLTAESRCAMLELTDTGTALTGAGTVICPTASKIYVVKNASGQNITVKTSGGTGVLVPNGRTTFLFCDGTNVLSAMTHTTSLELGTTTVVTAVLDEDNMASNSATSLATQQSIKAYVDAQVGANNELSEVLANGNTTGGNNILFGDNDKAIFGADSDLRVWHNGANSYVQDIGTGSLVLTSDGAAVLINVPADQNLANFNQNGSVYLRHSAAGVSTDRLQTTSTGVTVTGNANFDDNGKAIFGAGNDLQIFHNGNNSYIQDVGTGSLVLGSNGAAVVVSDAGDAQLANFNQNGSVYLKHVTAGVSTDRLQTTAAGVSITGTATIPIVDINSGNIDGTTIGGTTAAAITGTIIEATGSIATVSGATNERGVFIGHQNNINTSFVSRSENGVADTSNRLKFNFSANSFGIDVNGSERLSIASTGITTLDSLVTPTADINGGNIDGTVIGGTSRAAGSFDIVNISKTTAGYGSLEIGGSLGALIDLKAPFSDDYDARIQYNAGANLTLFTLANEPIQLNHQGTTRLATSSTGVDVTGSLSAVGKITTSGPTGAGGINLVSSNNVSNAGQKLAFYGANRSDTGEEMAYVRGLLGSDNGGAGNIQTGQLALGTAGVDRIRITGVGNVGIGTTTPILPLDVAGRAVISDGSPVDENAAYTLQVQRTGPNVLKLAAGATFTNYLALGTTSDALTTAISCSNADGALRIRTGNVDVARFLPNGNFGIGNANPTQKLEVGGNVAVTGRYTGTSAVIAGQGSGSVAMTVNDGYGNANLTFNHENGTPDVLGNGARITVNVDVTSSPSMDFQLGSATTVGVAYATTSRMTLSDTGLNVTDNLFAARIRPTAADDATEPGLQIYNEPDTGFFRAGANILGVTTGGTERMRILGGGGSLLLGTTVSYNANFRMSIAPDAGTGFIIYKAATTANHVAASFANSSGSTVGSISFTTSGTAYNTSSDYRLKENVTPIQGAADIVKAMRPATYTFKADGSWADGFIAHELQELHPVAVTGSKDGMKDEEYEVTPAVEATFDAEGVELTPAEDAVMGTRSVPDYQGVDYSKLTPILTAALQEALAKIDALTARIDALEGGV